jgi:hypothetical protein
VTASPPKTSDPPSDHPTRGNAPPEDPTLKKGPRGVQPDIAEADKIARTGSKDEVVRNQPPAGAWNDTSAD